MLSISFLLLWSRWLPGFISSQFLLVRDLGLTQSGFCPRILMAAIKVSAEVEIESEAQGPPPSTSGFCRRWFLGTADLGAPVPRGSHSSTAAHNRPASSLPEHRRRHQIVALTKSPFLFTQVNWSISNLIVGVKGRRVCHSEHLQRKICMPESRTLAFCSPQFLAKRLAKVCSTQVIPFLSSLRYLCQESAT